MNYSDITALLGQENESLFTYTCNKVTTDKLHLPSPNFIDDVFAPSNRNIQTLRNLQQIHNHGRLNSSGYLSILLVDQGIEHSAGGTGIISGRKSFQRPMKEGTALLNVIQDVYLEKEITVA